MKKAGFVRSMRATLLLMALLVSVCFAWAQPSGIPDRPNPPRLVNDLAGMLSSSEEAQLEERLLEFERETSNQVAIVTVPSLNGNDRAEFAIYLGKKWQIGQKDKNNGVVILAARDEKKIFIAVGKGLEGGLTDYTAGKISDKMGKYFSKRQFYEGFSLAVDEVISATKAEFKGEQADAKPAKRSKGPSALAVIIIVIVILVIISRNNRNNRRGGRYISGGGAGNFMAGWLLGELMRGGRGGGGNWGGGGDWGGGGSGGFGGFGGGDFGGGGAGGSWD